MALEQEKDAFQNIKNIVKPVFDLMVDIKKEGLEHIPQDGPGILVGNHRSDMDPFVVASAVPRYISWIAAEYTVRIPIFKNLIRETGVIPMQIDGQVSVSSIKKLMSVLRNGDLLGIFPEGHDYMVQNDFNAPMVQFHEGFGAFAYRSKAPITPFVIAPVEEVVETYPLNARVRSMMGLPDEVCQIPHRVTYRSVRIHFLPPIDPKPFRETPEKKAVPEIARVARETMHAKQVELGMVPNVPLDQRAGPADRRRYARSN